jgi:hypothetical protein
LMRQIGGAICVVSLCSGCGVFEYLFCVWLRVEFGSGLDGQI